jgi:leader peptidase (prepilin peptidase)/N-methyltransferase
MDIKEVVATPGFLATGLVTGHAGRRLLARLRRGAVFRSPACELFAAMASAIVGWRLAVGGLPVWWFAVPLLLAWLAVPLAAVDLVARRLPNALTYAAYPILGTALTVAAVYGPDHSLAVRALVGGALFGAAHLTVRRVAPSALGGGDAKLAGSLGAVLGALGWQALILATALAATITLLLALTPLAHRPLAHRPLAHRPLAPPTPSPPNRPTTSHPTDPATTHRTEALPTTKPATKIPPTPTPPVTNPPQPGTNPPQPGINRLQPGINRPQPGTNPPSPGTNRLQPGINRLQPGIKRPQPGTNPPSPGTNPPSPETDQPSPETDQPPPDTDQPPTETIPPPPEPIPPTRATPLLRRAVPHGPGLLVATWLLATFPGQALIGGVAG